SDLLVELSIRREGDVFLLRSRVYDDFFGFVDHILMQSNRECKQLCYAIFSEAVSKMD
ncbi:MAG: hypothetical protein RL012_671, partial [Bacteroidota bacterium]